jgi:hypothetical protein
VSGTRLEQDAAIVVAPIAGEAPEIQTDSKFAEALEGSVKRHIVLEQIDRTKQELQRVVFPGGAIVETAHEEAPRCIAIRLEAEGFSAVDGGGLQARLDGDCRRLALRFVIRVGWIAGSLGRTLLLGERDDGQSQ